MANNAVTAISEFAEPVEGYGFLAHTGNMVEFSPVLYPDTAMARDDDPFRKAALALMHLPLDEREIAFSDLLDAHMQAEFSAAMEAGGVVALTKRSRELWAIGAEIGVMAPLPSKH